MQAPVHPTPPIALHDVPAATIRAMDILLVLIIVLVIVIMWRGPKTLPLLGKAFGQGVKEARKEIDEIKSDSTSKDEPKA
jgi:Sec-independent protein translocase protein TatA